MNSPTSSVLSPIEKCRLHVEESSKIVIAKTERKVCCPEDLIVRNGFKLSGYYTDQPCLVTFYKDPAYVFGQTCECNLHREMGDVLWGECFSVFKSSGYRTTSCLFKSALDRIQYHWKAEDTKTDYFAFFDRRSDTFRKSTSHSWKDTPALAQWVVFLFQVLFNYATNPNSLFVVTETTFSELRDKTEDELEVMLVHIQKHFIKEFPDGKGISCFHSGLEVVPLTHAGFAMISFDQGNPTLKSDVLGQTWLLSSWDEQVQRRHDTR